MNVETPWRSVRTNDRSDNPTTLFVGSSIIRYIDQDKLSNTDVKCFSRVNKDLLHEEIRKLSGYKTYDRIVIVAGGDDCSNSKDTTTILNSYLVNRHSFCVQYLSPR